MPLDKHTRFFIEVAIYNFLKMRHLKGKEATSEEIRTDLRSRRYRATLNLRQVAAICRSMRKRGVLFSRSQNKKTFWRINPNFHRDNPAESLFGSHTPMTWKEFKEIVKRRTWKSSKKRK